MTRLFWHLVALVIGLGVAAILLGVTAGPVHVYGPSVALAVMVLPLLAASALAGLLTPRPGCDVPHRPDPRVEGSARTGARPAPFPGTRPTTLPARQVNPRLSSLALPGRAPVRT